MKWPWTKEEPKPEPKTITGWELDIRFKDNSRQSFSHPEFRNLFLVYHWFIARKSPVYDVTYDNGRSVIIREQVKQMTLNNKTLIDRWAKEET